MKWDDLKLFIAIADSKTLAGAARLLGQNHSTVFRRLNSLEEGLRTRLFERLPEGYVLTPVGERMLELSTEANEAIDRIEREVAGRDMDPSGTVRLTTAPNIATTLLPPVIAKLRKTHPGISLEVSVGDTDFDLGRREADIALRATPNPPEQLVGRHLADLSWWVWAPRKSRRTANTMTELADATFIGANQTLMRLEAYQWLENHFAERVVARCSDLSTVAALVREGIGYGVLPTDYQDDRLRRLFEIPGINGQLWLLTHPDLRHAQRVQVVWQTLAEEVPALLRDAQEGR